MRDGAMQHPLQLYEEEYADYFRIFCDSALAETLQEKESTDAFSRCSRFSSIACTEARDAILNCLARQATRWRDLGLRQPTGDTVKLRVPFAGR